MRQAGRVIRGRSSLAVVLASGIGVGLAGCQQQAAPNRTPPPTAVTVVEARTMDVSVLAKPIGTTRALKQVSIRARVRGFLTEKHFEEGSEVKEGQLLFVIDEAPFKATLDSALARRDEAAASLAKAKNSKAPEITSAQIDADQALLELARVDERRQKSIRTRGANSQEDVDQAVANRKKLEAQIESDRASFTQAKTDYDVNIHAAEAQLAAAEAEVKQAEIDLGYCRMNAPINGRIGEAKVKLGNLVGSEGGQNPTELATVQQLDPMGVDMQVSSRHLGRAARLVPQGIGIKLIRQGLEGDEVHPYRGKTLFIDNAIDPSTSTFLIRAEVPNPQRTLLPGEYVKLEVVVESIKGALVVPERAVVETQAGPVVFVVDASKKVAMVAVKVRDVETAEGLRVVEPAKEGLKSGDLVVVEGLQMIRPGMAVEPKRAGAAG